MLTLNPGTEDEMEVWGYQTNTIKYLLTLLGRYTIVKGDLGGTRPTPSSTYINLTR
jgi:hypothetical protein